MVALNRSPEFNSSKQKPSAAELFGTWGHHWANSEELNYAIHYNKFQASELSGTETADFFSYCLCISMLQTQEPLAYDHFGPSDHDLNKIGKRPLGNAIASEASGSEGEDFFNNFSMIQT